jgi:hypothetical protein
MHRAEATSATIRSDGGGAPLVSTVSVVNARAGAKNSPRDCIVGDCIFCDVEFHVLIVHVATTSTPSPADRMACLSVPRCLPFRALFG